jgi:nucleotide-binding universal stress UspA family protein
MFARILVPTDFSAASEGALEQGRRLAIHFHATLHLIHVAENLFLRAVVGDPRSLEAAAARQLQDQLTETDRQHGAIAVVNRSDEPANEILRYAESANIDLIVIGTHGRTGLARVVLGSVAEDVVRRAPCPVLIVRPAAMTTGPAGE